MPRRCCVPGCRSNYKGEPYTNVFSFPKEPEQRLKWERQIHRKDFKVTDSSVVCIKHFDERDIERNHTAKRDDGTLLVIPRKSPVLDKDAYPTIFNGQPSYLSTQLPAKRKNPEERHNKLLKRKEEEFQEWCSQDTILNFEAFKNEVKDKLPEDWILIPGDKDVFLGKVDVSKAPHFTISIRISSDLIVFIWKHNLPLPKSKLSWLLGTESKCDLWSKWDSLISVLNGLESEYNVDLQLHTILNALSELLEDCAEKEISNKETLLFLRDQFELCLKSSPRYNPDILLWATKFYFSFPAAYKLVRNSCKLVLPHPFYLRTLIQNLGPVESGVQSSHIKYLEQKNLQLSDREKLVVLMMDEVYVKPGATYKGGKIDGLATNSNTEATTLQAFLISSIFSRNKDVVGLYPMKNQNADELFDLLVHILKVLNETKYTVICVISDNNRVNRKTYEKMCGGVLKPSIENPVSPGDKLFLLFDTVHILKSIRNNWINNKETNQTFYIPPMKNLNIDMSLSPEVFLPDKLFASVCHLKALYKEESNSVIKLAPSLTQKSLYPNHLERQNVSLALKLFDDKNIAALDSARSTLGNDVIGTSHFINIISKWWKIVNVKTPLKGKHKRDMYCDPISSMNSASISFLEKFIVWLDEWNAIPSPSFSKKNSRSGKLSCETSVALKHTSQTILELCAHLFLNLTPPPNYILLGKFQSDDLEARFGQYRTMCGGNYHVSVTQVLESERKLKILSLIHLKSAKEGDFKIKDFLKSCNVEEEEDFEASDLFFDVLLSCNLCDTLSSNLHVVIYIAGYVAKATSDNCNMCRNSLTIEETLSYEIADNAKRYLSALDRGGLLWPNDFCLNICKTVLTVFETCISCDYEEKFLKVKNQRCFIRQLTIEKLSDEGYKFANVCECGKTEKSLISACINTMTNILLNNYTKIRNDNIRNKNSESKNKGKTVNRKLLTLTC